MCGHRSSYKILLVTLPQPPPVLKSFVQQLTSVQSLINFVPSTQVHLMASPTSPPISPISSEGSTMSLSSDRDRSPGSPTIPTGSPDRQPTRPSSPSRDQPSRSSDRGWYAPIVPDQHESLSNPRLVGSLSTDAGLSDRSSEPCPLPTPPAAPDASRPDPSSAGQVQACSIVLVQDRGPSSIVFHNRVSHSIILFLLLQFFATSTISILVAPHHSER